METMYIDKVPYIDLFTGCPEVIHNIIHVTRTYRAREVVKIWVRIKDVQV